MRGSPAHTIVLDQLIRVHKPDNCYVSVFTYHENCAKISHQVYYKEDGPFLGSHCQIATMSVADDRVVLCSRRQKIVNLGGTSKFRTGGVGYTKVNYSSHN